MGSIRNRLAAVCAGLLLAAGTAEAGVKLTLAETIPDLGDATYSAKPGEVKVTLPNGVLEFTWTEMPSTFDETGFKITLSVSARMEGDAANAGDKRPVHVTFFGPVDTDPSPAWAEIMIGPGVATAASEEIIVKPEAGLEDGQTIDIRVGTDLGPTVIYRYTVSTDG
ncbi:hypothetical protein sos41_19210 [Alphaproteobacteria bacterium SO-S41]|nr:hypothetical protein sos41_19210 [Alphaproteobacteria bacterium SO-S41]